MIAREGGTSRGTPAPMTQGRGTAHDCRRLCWAPSRCTCSPQPLQARTEPTDHGLRAEKCMRVPVAGGRVGGRVCCLTPPCSLSTRDAQLPRRGGAEKEQGLRPITCSGTDNFCNCHGYRYRGRFLSPIPMSSVTSLHDTCCTHCV